MCGIQSKACEQAIISLYRLLACLLPSFLPGFLPSFLPSSLSTFLSFSFSLFLSPPLSLSLATLHFTNKKLETYLRVSLCMEKLQGKYSCDHVGKPPRSPSTWSWWGRRGSSQSSLCVTSLNWITPRNGAGLPCPLQYLHEPLGQTEVSGPARISQRSLWLFHGAALPLFSSHLLWFWFSSFFFSEWKILYTKGFSNVW